MEIVLITLLGAAGGYFYWKFIACRTGFCPLTSNKYFSIFMGAVLAILLYTK
ncbi:MAG TPA: hypothetical protein PKC24_08380 [Cyclobacteriaceae bacterium]|nr:hypothetical protein [Cyclobacteriaceae bacterium]